jgi:predicted Co/Zn/Cd cation transporter (cation efflux family)
MTTFYDPRLGTYPKPRIKLSIKMGVLAGIIWGLFFTSYYSMLPDTEFAFISSTMCFVALILFIFAWPHLVKSFKDAAEEGRIKRGRV